MRFSGKIALVTGGTSGIGLAAARRLADEGARVIVLGRAGRRLDDVASERWQNVETVAADVTKPEDLASALAEVRKRHGRIDILVVSAGVSNAPSVGELDVARYGALMDVNCKGAVFAFVHALPLLSDAASVVFVGSVAGRKGQPGDALYAGSKGFIRAFARSAGTDPALLAHGIRVNVVSPGPIETPLTHEATSNPDVRTYVEQQLVPMKRWGRAGEVAEAILFLCSSASSFTTGGEITVDGGMAHA